MPYHLIPRALTVDREGKPIDNDRVRVPDPLLTFLPAYDTRQQAHEAIATSRWEPSPDYLSVVVYGGWNVDTPAGCPLTVYFRPGAGEYAAAKTREIERLERGEYLPIPPIPHHGTEDYATRFAHFSTDKTGMIAYSPSWEFLVQDRQLRVRPGKYLGTFYPQLPPEASIVFAGQCGAIVSAELQITTDPQDIVRVYTRGPGSCMGGKHSHDFRSDSHPAKVYGDSPDLALAYTGTTEEPIARSIVWPERKTYSRIYGNVALLQAMLENAGYRQGYPDGARVRAVQDGNGRYMMPYVDGIGGARKDGAYFVFGRGPWCTDRTDGLTSTGCDDDDDDDDGNVCANCETAIGYDETYCQSCDDDRWTCQRCDGESFDTSQQNHVADHDAYYCDHCYGEYVQTCGNCDDTYDIGRGARSDRRDREDRNLTGLCLSCAYAHDRCSECDALIDRTDDDPVLCDSCKPPVTVVTRYKGPGTQSLTAQLHAYAYDRGYTDVQA